MSKITPWLAKDSFNHWLLRFASMSTLPVVDTGLGQNRLLTNSSSPNEIPIHTARDDLALNIFVVSFC